MNLKLRSLVSSKVRLIFFILLLFSIRAYSQLNTSNFTQYTEKDGLPGVQATRVLVDRLGYVWTGTVNGLARYDGYSFNSSASLPSKNSQAGLALADPPCYEKASSFITLFFSVQLNFSS